MRHNSQSSNRFSPRKVAQATIVLGMSLYAVTATFCPVEAKKDPDSPLTYDTQGYLEKATKYARSGKKEKAIGLLQSALDSANDIPKCLAVANFIEEYRYPLVDARRACIQKAYSLCQTREDYITVAIKSRQFETYEVTRQCVNTLISTAKTPEDLYDLARKSQEVSLNDVAHLSMEKAYTLVRNVPDALRFAHEVKLLGMDDMVRKVIKDLIDDEPETHRLMTLLKNIEIYKYPDLNRYLLKKALDQSKSVDDFAEIWEAARRHREKDIFDVAAFRGKKMQLIQKVKQDRESYQQKVQEWKTGQQGGDQGQQQQQQSPSGF